jgi:aspartyl protease family protein
MPTGFMLRHFIALCVLLACGAAPIVARCADIALIGVIGDQAAVVAVDGGEPRTIKVGQTRAGITVLSIERSRATIEVEGKTRVLSLGQHYRNPGAAAAGSSSRQSVALAADARGHFVTEGSINGHPILFLVDTGASTVAIPAADALRMGIDYRKGALGKTRTAGGIVSVYRVTLDRVRLGTIEASGVEAVIIEEGLDIALLGMSFLSRLELRQEGRTMTLIKRF